MQDQNHIPEFEGLSEREKEVISMLEKSFTLTTPIYTTIEAGGNTADLELHAVNLGEIALPGNKIAFQGMVLDAQCNTENDHSNDYQKASVQAIIASSPLFASNQSKTLGINTIYNSEGILVAGARILFLPNPIAKWRKTQAGGPGGMGEVRIDSGMLQIADLQYAKAAEELFEKFDTEDFDEIMEKCKEEGVPAPDIHSCSAEEKAANETDPLKKHWIDYVSNRSRINGFEALDISSGFGDGTYTVYEGLDAEGKVCQILCDFRVLYEESFLRYIWL